jgi:SapC
VPNIVVLNSSAHKDLRVHAQASPAMGDNQRFVAVVISEFPALALQCPILLSKDANTGQFYFGAMLGFDEGENLFLDGYVDRSASRPLNLQRGPFYASGSDLAIDLDHPRVAESGDQPLFGEGGEPSPYLNSISALMRELKPGQERTKLFIDTLLELKLVEAVDISAQFDDGTRREVQGLYTISRDALKDLPDSAAVVLFRRGYLQLIYLLLLSLRHVTTLAQMRNRRLLPQNSSRIS